MEKDTEVHQESQNVEMCISLKHFVADGTRSGRSYIFF